MRILSNSTKSSAGRLSSAQRAAVVAILPDNCHPSSLTDLC